MLVEDIILCVIVGVSILPDTSVGGTIGCYEDTKERVWPYGRNILHMNSPRLCQNLCAGHRYAGLQNKNECHCGDTVPPNSLPAQRCGHKCPGDASATCGGGWAMNVLNVPSISYALDPGTHLGCFQDNQQRIWNNGLHRLTNNSPQLCRNLCQGHRYAGMEARAWCMCGDTMPIIKLPPGLCGGNCPGAVGVKCGGNWTLEVYDIEPGASQPHSDIAAVPWVDGSPQRVGCYEDNKDRVWKNGYNTLKDNSPKQCVELCAGFKFAGLQYGSQCHCGDILPTKSLPIDRCSTPCPGQYGATCGGSWTMEVFHAAPAKLPEVLISTDPSYLGCYDNTVEHRVWMNGNNIIQRNTPTLCKSLCTGFKYAGVQARNQCYCGNVIPQHVAHPSTCNTTCPGDRKLFCGGDFTMQVFGITPRLKTEMTSHTRIGCYEDTKTRVWKNGMSKIEFNGPQVCKNLCVGYRYFGLESRLWCLCGDSIPPTPIDPALCKYNCPADQSNKCGGPWAIDVYEMASSSSTEQCGKRKLHQAGQQLISGGATADNEQFPWHVGIYQVDGKSSGLSQICGGTLISPSLVISAAHCFWDSAGKRKKDAKSYKMAAGKLQRDWRLDDAGTQRRDAAEIFVHEHYLGFDRLLQHDISVVKVTSPFMITSFVNIICIDWKNLFEKQQLTNGNLGTIAGWGITESDRVSDILKYVRLPYVPLVSCLALVDDEFKAYLTEDKICAGYVNKSISVCSGDSGSGLVFPQRAQDGERYYLRGVASVGHVPSASSISKCNNQQIAGFTLVSVYTTWLEQFVIFAG